MVKEYLAITFEDINSKFDPVLEGPESLRGEIRELAKKLTSVLIRLILRSIH